MNFYLNHRSVTNRSTRKPALRTLLIAFFLFVFALSISTIADAQNKTLSLDIRNKTIKEALLQIENQSEFRFIYENENVNLDKKVSLQATNQTIEQVLKQLFSADGIKYVITNNNLILVNPSSKEIPSLQKETQEITVSGSITASNGDPLPGASVVIKGSKIGIVSDVNGQYSITVPNPNAILSFSFIGYQPKDAPVANKSTLNISLQEDAELMDEVVVVGYGTQKKVTLTGSVVSLKGSEVIKSPAVNVVNSLQGRLPGVIINNRSGEPGSDEPSLSIRGKSTTGNSSALIIIDGVERGGLGQINPNDIENISVLKDASAAIYGARAANGVILITTKRGSSAKPIINFSFNQGFSQPTRKPQMADSYTFGMVANEIEVSDGRPRTYTDEELQKFRDGSDPNYANTNWYDFIIRDLTPQHRTNVSVSGGNDRVSYYLSLGEVMQEGMYTQGSTKINQYNIRSNVDVKITDNLKVGMNISGRNEDKHYPTQGVNNLNSHIYLYQPIWTPYWQGTNLMKPNRDNENILNWVGDNAGTRDYNIKTLQSSVFFKWDLPWVAGLSIDGNGSYDATNTFNKNFKTPTYVYYKDASTGELKKGRSGSGVNQAVLDEKSEMNSSFYLSTKINYERKIDKHSFAAMIGYEQTKTNGDWLSAYRNKYLSTSLPQLFAGSTNKLEQGNDGSATKNARQNYFGRLSYDYGSKYMAQFTLRRDGSSNFPESKRFGYFPSTSVGWRISEESFMDDINVISNLKIRGSFGSMGNDLVDGFQYLTTYGFGNNYVFGNEENSGLVQTKVSNPNITWETAKTWNLGLDATLWDGLLGIELDLFKTRRSNILTKRTAVIPAYTGMTLPDENIGIVDNKGFELVLTHANRRHELKYSLTGNMSFARNKVIFSDEQPAAEQYQLATGKPIGSELRYQAIGIFADQAAVDSYPHLAGAVPGDIRYEDVNGDKEINSLDRMRTTKTNTPEIVFGFSATFEYKGFDVSVLLQGQERAIQHFQSWFPALNPSFGNFLSWRADDRWSPDNTQASMPRASSNTLNNNGAGDYSSTQWTLNAGFLRLKNVEIGYNLPKTICEKLKLQALRLSVSGNNLFIIYDHMKDLGFDPETSDFWYYQQQRVFNFGVNLTF